MSRTPIQRARPQHSRGGRLRRRETATGYLLLAPSLVGISIFLVLPVFVVFWLSLHSWDLLSPARWVGLDNFTHVLSSPQVANTMFVTLFFVLIVIPVQTSLGLLTALMLDRRLPGSNLFRVVYVIPWISAPLALGVVWRWILDPSNGALNDLLGHRVEWLASPSLALPSVAAVAVWTHVGYVTLFFLAGLNSIPPELYEAARIDGAGERQMFWQITLPLLRPTTFFVLVTGLIASFQVFDLVYAMTGGAGPSGSTDVIAARIYHEAFEAFRLGRAAALAVLLFVVLVVVTVAQHFYFRRRITYDLS